MSGDHYFTDKPASTPEHGLIKTVLRGKQYSFNTATGVFSVKRVDFGTRVLVDYMNIPKSGRFLDMGCGIGVIGIVAARENPELSVSLTDINHRAVNLTRDNVKRYNLKNCSIYEGYLYESLGDQQFDTIVSNPPISAGMRKVVFPLVEGALERLIDGGSVQLVIQSNKGGKMLTGFLDDVYGNHTVVTRKSGYRVLSAVKN